MKQFTQHITIERLQGTESAVPAVGYNIYDFNLCKQFNRKTPMKEKIHLFS